MKLKNESTFEFFSNCSICRRWRCKPRTPLTVQQKLQHKQFPLLRQQQFQFLTSVVSLLPTTRFFLVSYIASLLKKQNRSIKQERHFVSNVIYVKMRTHTLIVEKEKRSLFKYIIYINTKESYVQRNGNNIQQQQVSIEKVYG